MTLAETLGSIGVGLLLVAFALISSGLLGRRDRLYLGLNLVGAGLAGYAAFLIGFLPFVVLEGTWAAVALVSLLRLTRAA